MCMYRNDAMFRIVTYRFLDIDLLQVDTSDNALRYESICSIDNPNEIWIVFWIVYACSCQVSSSIGLYYKLVYVQLHVYKKLLKGYDCSLIVMQRPHPVQY
jgi:hypothetical protein